MLTEKEDTSCNSPKPKSSMTPSGSCPRIARCPMAIACEHERGHAMHNPSHCWYSWKAHKGKLTVTRPQEIQGRHSFGTLLNIINVPRSVRQYRSFKGGQGMVSNVIDSRDGEQHLQGLGRPE